MRRRLPVPPAADAIRGGRFRRTQTTWHPRGAPPARCRQESAGSPGLHFRLHHRQHCYLWPLTGWHVASPDGHAHLPQGTARTVDVQLCGSRRLPENTTDALRAGSAAAHGDCPGGRSRSQETLHPGLLLPCLPVTPPQQWQRATGQRQSGRPAAHRPGLPGRPTRHGRHGRRLQDYPEHHGSPVTQTLDEKGYVHREREQR